MGVYRRKGSHFWYVWLDGAAKPRVNTKIPIGTTAEQRKKSRKKAEDVYFRMMLARAGDRFGLPSQKPARTFKAHREWYAEHVTPLKRSATIEAHQLERLGEFFDDHELTKIDQALVREWRGLQAKTKKGSTILREEALVRHVLATAIPEYLDRHPLVGLKSVRVAPTDTRVLSFDEEARLLAVLPPVERTMVIAALDTLLRMSNIIQLARAQDHGTYLFADTKAGAVKVPISTRLRAALDALPATPRYFFPAYAQAGTDRTRDMFVRACKAAEIPIGRKTGGVSFHCLRHTGATRMLAAGVDAKTVMRLGGWQNLRVLERYLHPTDAASVAAVEAVARRA